MAHTTGKSPRSAPASAGACRTPTRPTTGGPRAAAIGSRPASPARPNKPAPRAKSESADRPSPETAAAVRVGGGVDGQAKPAPGPTRRFVEPYRFDDHQRGLIDTALVDAGIDDRTARSIFIGAIAYELAVFKDAITAAQLPTGPALPASERAPPASEQAPPASEQAPPASERSPPASEQSPPASERSPNPQGAASALAELVGAATTLADLITALDPSARERLSDRLRQTDPFARRYGEDYLAALVTETRRIATACTDGDAEAAGSATRGAVATPVTSDAPAVAANQRIPTPNSPARVERDAAPSLPQTAQDPVQQFIAHAARVYRECFDRAPGTAGNDPFRRALGAIARATDTPIPTTVRVLRQALRT